MNDKELIEALIERDGAVTQRFFFEQCRPLFKSIIGFVFTYEVDYNEFVNEFYIYLMENDAYRLRQFEGRSSIYQWMKITAIRYFCQKRDKMIDNTSKETLITERDDNSDEEKRITNEIDVHTLLKKLLNKRYAYVLKRLIIEDAEPKDVAKELETTVDNLYNIKKRAIEAITKIVLGETGRYKNKSVKSSVV